ncbi:MAG: M20/M25/M40 family metallo-hydrolase [Patescibacteria group bacterium]|jgi:succinyl-diaminopimelate desuccinylase
MNKQQEILALSKRLISIPSVVGDFAAQQKCLDFIERYFKGLPALKVKRFRFGDHGSLLFYNQSVKNPDVCFYGHVDVVKAEKRQFSPKVKGDKLFGRGASDMKAVLAAQMVLLKDLIKSGYAGSVALLVVTDEEIGGALGAQKIADEFNFRPGCILVPDGGDNWKMSIGEKGVHWTEIAFEGKPDHGSRPWLGVNAGEELMAAYEKIKKSFRQAKSEKDSLLTINLGAIEGGVNYNQVMPSATMGLDIRYPKNIKLSEIKKKIKAALPLYAKVKSLEESPAWSVDLDNKLIKRFTRSACKVLRRKKIEQQISCGASDARMFGWIGVPTIVFKPVCGGMHSRDEWVSIKALGKFYDIYKDFLLSK